MNYHTIMDKYGLPPERPVILLRPLVSKRTWNLLTRNGFGTIEAVQLAQTLGMLPGIHNMGPAALLEIRLALDNLPPGTEGESRGDVPAKPGLSGRELLVLLRLAEAGMSEPAWAVNGNHQYRDEAQAALEHLHLVVHGVPRPDGVPDPGGPREDTVPGVQGHDPVVFGEPPKGFAYRAGAGSGGTPGSSRIPSGAVPEPDWDNSLIRERRRTFVNHLGEGGTEPDDTGRPLPPTDDDSNAEFEGYDMSDVQPPPWRLGQGWEQERGGL